MRAQELPQWIDKEELSSITFHHTETEVENPLEIRRQLSKALVLGNTDKHKVRITFDCDKGLKMVKTTIWSLGERHVVLKKGLTIPVDNIIEVRLL